MIIPAIRTILPVLLKSARYTPKTKDVEILSRLLNRMKYLRSNSSSVRTAARMAVQECKQPHQSVNPTVAWFQRQWGWNEEKLIEVLETLWNSLK